MQMSFKLLCQKFEHLMAVWWCTAKK